MALLGSIITSLRWQDVVDIALNSYILFRLYVLFRGTFVLRVVAVFFLLWGFLRVAIELGMIVTTWVLQGILAVAALIIIIVFRNEIRGVFQTRTMRNLFWGMPRRTNAAVPEAVATAMFQLARRRIGALVAIPARESIDDQLQGGVPVDAILTPELLSSLFWTGSPVHDGAVFIRDGRIRRAGTVLPLTHRNDVPSRYGTRHRAAIGLTEATDALVVVVSEESGEVAYATGGRLVRVDRPEALVAKIREHQGMHESRPKRERVRRAAETSLALLVSVSLVTGLWLSFSRGRESLRTVDVSVEYVNRPTGMEILDASANTVSLRLSGFGPIITALSPDQIPVRLDLSKGVVGTNSFTVTADNISLPPGVELKHIDPSVINVRMDIITEKTLPVQVDWTGRLNPRLILSSVTVSPPQVQVIGGKEILDRIETVYTEKVPLDGVTQSGSQTVRLALTPASLKVAPGGEDRVTIQYTVRKRLPAGESPLGGTAASTANGAAGGLN